jgi:hypothetical protein
LGESTVLSGRKAISGYCQRSWEVILGWHRNLAFPMRKINDVWESDRALVDEWRKGQIKGCQGNT